MSDMQIGVELLCHLDYRMEDGEAIITRIAPLNGLPEIPFESLPVDERRALSANAKNHYFKSLNEPHE